MRHSFWLIRHALVAKTSLCYLYGTDDVPVCDVTMEEDAPRYAALAARLPRPARLVCTPLSRTKLTAEAIIRAGYPAQAPMVDAAFVEQDFGELQGMPIASFDARPVGNIVATLNDSASRHPFWPIHAAEMPPGGERFDDVITRVGAGLENLRASSAGQNTIIVSHGGAIRAACAYALGLTAHQALCLAVDNISITRLEHNDRGWRVLSVNEHLSISSCETTGMPSTADTRIQHNQKQGAIS